jgi:hypothetical protein
VESAPGALVLRLIARKTILVLLCKSILKIGMAELIDSTRLAQDLTC